MLRSLICALVVVGLVSFVQAGDPANRAVKGAPKDVVKAEPKTVEGEVTKVDADKNKVTIKVKDKEAEYSCADKCACCDDAGKDMKLADLKGKKVKATLNDKGKITKIECVK